MATVSIYLSLQFLLHPDGITTHSGRRSFILELLRTYDGWPGAIFFAASGGAFAWWTLRAGWRFFTNRAAVHLSERTLRFDEAFRPELIVSIEHVEEAILYEEASGRLLGLVPPINTLLVRWAQSGAPSSRKRKIRSNTIEGGAEALEAFAQYVRAEMAKSR